jgi:hypothetical protein
MTDINSGIRTRENEVNKIHMYMGSQRCSLHKSPSYSIFANSLSLSSFKIKIVAVVAAPLAADIFPFAITG